jgi:parallel beta-helix repeat protein
MLTLVFNIQPVKASGTIYIRADGSIDPSDAPISTFDNVTYTLNGNITSDADGIVIERSNVILEGVGHTIQGTGSWDYKGIGLEWQNNVTIRNTSINGFYCGVRLQDSSNNNLFGNNVTENTSYGIWLQDSSKNTLRNNKMTDNRYNFWVGGYSLLDFVNDVDSSNTVNAQPLYYWVNRTDETIPLDAGYVALVNCTHIVVQNLNLRGNGDGILLAYTADSRIIKNSLTDACGIYVWYSSHSNNISGNKITNSIYGIYLYGHSNHNWISENNIRNSSYGLWLWDSNQNSIIGNNITTSTGYAIGLEYSMGNNIYHNNFIDNIIQVSTDTHNVWDSGYPSGGNYWSDYVGGDLFSGPYQNETGSDGKGDTPYSIDSNNVDNYPLISPWNPLPVHNINTGLDYGTIQEAINTPETLDGHTIFVETGTYYENVVVNKTVSLVGEDVQSTIIDGSGMGRVVMITVADVNVTGFTIRNSGGPLQAGIYLLLYTISLRGASHCNISGNHVTNNSYGISLYGSSYNSISGNNIANNRYGIYLGGGASNNKISGNNITNNIYGAFFDYSIKNNTVYGNNITNNTLGICLDGYISATYKECPENNTIYENNIADNTEAGVKLLGLDNIFYHNNFLNNTIVIGSEFSSGGTNDPNLSKNILDDGYPSGGNYWSDYDGTDLYSGPYQNETGSDGIGDTPYVIGANNRDNYPLLPPAQYVPIVGDMNLDKTVDISDAILAALAFGSRPGDPNWNSQADLNHDNEVDIFDVIILANNFGKH